MNRTTRFVSVAIFAMVGGSCMASVRPPACVTPPSGLVSWWPGDGDSRDVVGSSDGVLRNGATFGEGFVTSGGGQGFAFGGAYDVVYVADSPELNPTGAQGFTLSAWAQTNTTSGNGTVIGKGDPWEEQYVIDQIAGHWRAFVRLSDNRDVRINAKPVRTGVFSHLALTWDGVVLRFYVDGVSAGSAPASSIKSSNVFLGIGGRSQSGFGDEELELGFIGVIDEVALFSRALGADEVTTIFNAGRNGKCKP